MKEIPRMDEDEIAAVATQLVTGKMIDAESFPIDMLSQIFLPLAFGALDELEDATTVGTILGDYADVFENGVNGYPIFPRCYLVHVEDWPIITARVEAAYLALRPTASEGGQ